MPKTIRPLEETDLEALKDFADMAIGNGYFSLDELKHKFLQSQKNGLMTSFLLIAEDGKSIEGLRLSFPPGNWSKGKGAKLSPHLWHVPINDVGYFQSLFLHPNATGQGWGQKLSLAAATVIKKLGAKAIVCHSWVESPNNSSNKYLLAMGFKPVVKYPEYWKDVDYECTRCGKPCFCTAEEMILYL